MKRLCVNQFLFSFSFLMMIWQETKTGADMPKWQQQLRRGQ